MINQENSSSGKIHKDAASLFKNLLTQVQNLPGRNGCVLSNFLNVVRNIPVGSYSLQHRDSKLIEPNNFHSFLRYFICPWTSLKKKKKSCRIAEWAMNRGSGGVPGLLVPILAPANSAKIVGNSLSSVSSL